MQGMGRKGRILEMLCPHVQGSYYYSFTVWQRGHFDDGQMIVLAKDYQTPLTQEYIFTADVTLFVSHPQNSLSRFTS